MFHHVVLLDSLTGAGFNPQTSKQIKIKIESSSTSGITTHNVLTYFRFLPANVVSILLTTEWLKTVDTNDLSAMLFILNGRMDSVQFIFNRGTTLGLELTIVPTAIDRDRFDLSQNQLWRVPIAVLVKVLGATASCIKELILVYNELDRLSETDLLDLLRAFPADLEWVDLRGNNFENLEASFIARHLFELVVSLALKPHALAFDLIKSRLTLLEHHIAPIITALEQQRNYLSCLVAGLLLVGRVHIDYKESAPDVDSESMEIRTHEAINQYATVARNGALRSRANLLLWLLKTNTTIASVELRLAGFDIPNPPEDITKLCKPSKPYSPPLANEESLQKKYFSSFFARFFTIKAEQGKPDSKRTEQLLITYPV